MTGEGDDLVRRGVVEFAVAAPRMAKNERRKQIPCCARNDNFAV